MKKQWIAMIGGGALAVIVAAAGASFAQAGDDRDIQGTIPVADQAEAQYPAMAAITLDQALQKAVASTPGQVLKAELEDANGFLVYGIEVVGADQAVMDVTIDAGSGKVLATHKDETDRRDCERGDRDHEDHEHDDED